jgi:hypothetical protein
LIPQTKAHAKAQRCKVNAKFFSFAFPRSAAGQALRNPAGVALAALRRVKVFAFSAKILRYRTNGKR